LITLPHDPVKSKHGRTVVDALPKRGHEPALFSMRTYGAIQVWAQAAAKAGSLELKKMTKFLLTNIFHTVLRKVTFNNHGDMKQDGFVWCQCHNGKYLPKVFKKKPA